MELFVLITIAIFSVYLFYETKIYLAFWNFIFQLLKVILKVASADTVIYKTTLSAFIVALMFGYLYKFRNVVFFKKKPYTVNIRLLELRTDEKKRNRLAIAILALLVINFIAAIVYSKLEG